MKVYKGLNLNIREKEIISFTGGGGKTTTLFTLGRELRGLDKKVLITTTTKMENPSEGYDYYFLGNIPGDFKPSRGTITLVGGDAVGRKFIGLSLERLNRIIERDIFDFVLIEADGAKRLPIKAMGHHEPVISKYTTKTIGIIGVDALNKPIETIVHRPEIFTEVVGKEMGDLVLGEDIVKVILHPKGIFKQAKGEKVFLLNKINNQGALEQGRLIRKILREKSFPGQVVLGDIKTPIFY